MTLAGRRILVLEDEALVSMLIEDVLADERCIVIGPFNSVDEALTAARNETLDAALLDINIFGTRSYPVAQVLEGRGVPFILLTGYGTDAAPADRPEWPVCEKPFLVQDLIRQLAHLIDRPH